MRWHIGKCAGSFISMIILASVAGCTGSTQHTNQTFSGDEVFSSTPPFKTLEPDHYEAIRTVVFDDGAKTSEIARSKIAKDGNSRRDEANLGGKTIVNLDLPEGHFVLLPESRVYAEVQKPIQAANGLSTALSLEDSVDQPLIRGGTEAFYLSLGPETVGNRKTQKYRVSVNSSTASNVRSTETTVWVDEELGMPIKTESKSITGAHTIIELTDIRIETDKEQFHIPAGFQKVKAEDIQRMLQ